MDKNSTFFTKIFQKSLFWVVFMKSHPYYTPTIFRRQTFFIMVNKGQKSTILEKKLKIIKNCQKNINFSKIWLLSPRIWLVAQTCPPLPDIWSLSKKIFFLMKSEIFWLFFRKSRFLTPPTLVKVQQREVQSKSAIRKKSFFHRFRTACKKLEKFIGWVRRTVSEIFFGHIWVEPRTGRGPYPCPTW